MSTPVQFPTSPRPSLRVSRSANGADVVIAGLGGGGEGLKVHGLAPRALKEAESRWGTDLATLARRMGGSGKVGSTVVLPWQDGSLVLTGVGEADLDDTTVRKAVGPALRRAVELAGELGGNVSVAVDMGLTEPHQVRAAAEAAVLGAYRIPRLSDSDPEPTVESITVVSTGRSAKAEIARAETVADAVLLARDWVNASANLLFPESFAESAASAMEGIDDLDVEILDEKALADQGFGGILAVGGGSRRPPRLVRADYHPDGASTTIALVGKGITFDSGGLNIKPSDGMYTMRCDMGGAAAVLAAVRAVAQLGLKVRVVAYGCMAENMPSGSAWRPSDVVTMYGGTTVENANSDAEGRIVMADGLARASQDDPDLTVDVATLTGACMVALGNHIGGLMSSTARAADMVLDASDAAGEVFWELPITEEVRSGLHSDVADVKSSGARQGGAMAAAAFLQHFVPEGRDWVHLDIAGPAFNNGEAHDVTPKAATGYAVRTLVQLAADQAD